MLKIVIKIMRSLWNHLSYTVFMVICRILVL